MIQFVTFLGWWFVTLWWPLTGGSKGYDLNQLAELPVGSNRGAKLKTASKGRNSLGRKRWLLTRRSDFYGIIDLIDMSGIDSGTIPVTNHSNNQLKWYMIRQTTSEELQDIFLCKELGYLQVISISAYQACYACVTWSHKQIPWTIRFLHSGQFFSDGSQDGNQLVQASNASTVNFQSFESVFSDKSADRFGTDQASSCCQAKMIPQKERKTKKKKKTCANHFEPKEPWSTTLQSGISSLQFLFQQFHTRFQEIHSR